jgi:Fur family peroxide stress response transcriptional regulator
MKTELQNQQASKEKELEKICREHGLSLTIQRRAILDNLVCRTDHPTADQIYDDMKDQLKGISRTTVYRVLETLVSVGLARKISNPESKARFDADTSRHHHLTCIECGSIMDIHDRDLNNIELPARFASDFEFIDYSISFTGRCSRCRTDKEI